MNKSRLLIVTDDANMGGTFRVAVQLATRLPRFFDVQFACPFNAKSAAACIAIASAGALIRDYQVSERNLERSTFAVGEAEELLEKAAPDVLLLVESAEIWSLLALKQVAERRGIPYVSVVNLLSADCLERFTQLREPAILAMQAAHAIVFVSNASKLRFEELLPEIGARRYAIPNSCPDKFFRKAEKDARMAMRKALGIGNDELVFLTAARIEPRKGQILCIEGLERLRDGGDISGVRLLLVGGGTTSHIEDLRKSIEKKKLSEHVLLLGPRDDIPDLLEAGDVFVLTSFAEGMPLSIIEAMAKGRPVIATNVDGIPEQIDGSIGILVPSPYQAESTCAAAIADAMAFMQQNPEIRTGMGNCARLRALRLFSEDRMIREYADIILIAAATRSNSKGLRFRGSSIKKKKSIIRSISNFVSDLGRGSVNGKLDRHELLLQGAQLELEQGAVIDFSDPLQCWNYARGGWNPTERGGVWSDGTISVIRLRMRQAIRRCRITFDLTPFVPPGHRQRTDVIVNGRQVCSWDFDVHVRELLTIDISMSDDNETSAEIELIHRTPTSPQAFGLGDDSRELAIFLHEIRIE